MTHELKIDSIHLNSLINRTKTFEIRKDDRPFEVGDELHLKEFNRETQEYGKNVLIAKIVGIFGRTEEEKPYVIDGHVILSLNVIIALTL